MRLSLGSIPGKDGQEVRVWEDGERRGKGGNKEVAVSQSYAHRPCGGWEAEMATLQPGPGMREGPSHGLRFPSLRPIYLT